MLWMFFAAFAIACVACLLQSVQRTDDQLKIRALPAVAAAVLLLLTVVMGLTASGRNVPGIGGGDPSETAEQFFSALEAGDLEAAGAYMEYYDDLGLSEAPADEHAALVHEALVSSYTYCLTGDASVSGVYAVQTAELTHLDIDALNEAVETATEKALQHIVDEKRKADVFDENEQYLPGIVEQAYDNALEAVTADVSGCLVTDTLEVKLVWTPWGWKISADEALLNAISGFAAY